jgi:hypothetical protein
MTLAFRLPQSHAPNSTEYFPRLGPLTARIEAYKDTLSKGEAFAARKEDFGVVGGHDELYPFG